MEIDNKLLVQLGLAALFTGLLLVVLYTKRRRESNGGPPEAAGAWPVIGHLHRLGPVHQLHRQLGAMADDLGPAFLLRLGLRRTLVVSSQSAARDCFNAANDRAFSSRPDSAAARLMGYDRAMVGFAPYGPYWRAIRKIATVRLLSVSRLNSVRHIRAGEIDRRVKALFSCSGVKIDLKKWCGDLTMDVMARMVVGRSVIDDDNDGCDGRRFREAISRFFYLLTVFVASDAVPWRVMDWVDFRGYKRMMRETAAEMDEVLAGWLAEHRRRREAARGGPAEEEDFMDVMLGAVDGGEIEGCDSDTVIKATCMALIIGGTDTTSVTLAGALFFMLTSPNVLERVLTELDTHVGNNRNVDESDIDNLVYLHAVVKETLRFTPAAPFIVPREATEECWVAGYRVPAGTQLFVNLWKLQMDPSVWTNPTKFDPDRFLADHSHVEPKGQHFEYIPFGSGRRSCPGIASSLQVMHLALARLAHGFRMELVGDGQSDMKDRLSLGNPKAAPLEILLFPRLPSHLYD